MKYGVKEAFSGVLINKAPGFTGWNFLDHRQVRFEFNRSTGRMGENLDQRWMAFAQDRTYLGESAFRLADERSAENLATLRRRLHSDDLTVVVNRQQMEKPAVYAAKRK